MVQCGQTVYLSARLAVATYSRCRLVRRDQCTADERPDGTHRVPDFRHTSRAPERRAWCATSLDHAGYFAAMHMPLLRRCDFTEHDRKESAGVVVIVLKRLSVLLRGFLTRLALTFG